MNCPSCQSSNHTKNGLLKGTQRYKCKTVAVIILVVMPIIKKKKRNDVFTLSMYLEGLGFCSISRLLNVSHVSVLNWIKKYGKDLETIRNPRPCEFMELDKMHSYIGNKKTINGFGLVLIGTQKNTLIWSWGSRSTKTGLKLWEKIKEQAVGLVTSDY